MCPPKSIDDAGGAVPPPASVPILDSNDDEVNGTPPSVSTKEEKAKGTAKDDDDEAEEVEASIEDTIQFKPFLKAYVLKLLAALRAPRKEGVELVMTEMQTSRSNNRPLFTRIHGKWYDLSTFLSIHPGGPVALNLAEGRDSTALFEMHHYLSDRTKLFKMMKPYEVHPKIARTLKTDDPRDDDGHYDWDSFHSDPFTVEIRDAAMDYFEVESKRRGIGLREATKATPFRWSVNVALLVGFYATLPSFAAGKWWTILVTPVLGWLASVNYWHDALHFGLSTDWRLNAMLPYLYPWSTSPWTWYHQHVVGHHAYPNVGHRDPDLLHAPRLMREHDSVPWRSEHETQGTWGRFAMVWSAGSGYGLSMLSDVKANVLGRYNSVVSYRTMDVGRFYLHTLGRIFYVSTVLMWPLCTMPLLKAFVFALLPISIFSWLFMLNTQINHLTHRTAHASDDNFWKHQIVTAQNFGVDSPWCFYFSGGLNHQIEHHLFPCVNHCHLPKLRPIIEEICRKHGVVYNKAGGYWDALRNHFDHTDRMAERPEGRTSRKVGKSSSGDGCEGTEGHAHQD